MSTNSVGALYARMSSHLQNEKSPEDQARVCRRRAETDGVTIPDENVFIDRAVSGTRPDREALEALKEAARARRFGVLYFEDLSRLGRESTQLMTLLKELVHGGVRVISINEGVDSASESWQILATILGFQHEQYVRDLGHRVRRGQSGTVLENLSSGDYCFGYRSEPIPGSEKSRKGRDSRPRRRVLIDPDTSLWVLRIFIWFAHEGESMQSIARLLTKLEAPKDHRATTKGWHHDYVRRVLTNEKYIGRWTWGKTRNKRHPTTGKIRQEAVPAADHVVVTREELRIVPQDLWDTAQALRRINQQKHPGPRGQIGQRGASYVDAYPKHEFAGLLYCSQCGSRFRTAGSNASRMACGGMYSNRCTVHTSISRERLRSLLLECLQQEVLATEERIGEILAAATRLVAETQASTPAELTRFSEESRTIERKLAQLNRLAEEGDGELQSTAKRIRELERRRDELAGEIRRLEDQKADPADLPTREWLLEELASLKEWVAGDSRELAAMFRAFTGGRVEMSAVIPPGKKRGYLQVRFKGNVLNVLAERMLRSADGTDAKSCRSARLLQRVCRDATFEVDRVIDTQPPSAVAELADQVKEMWDRGMLLTDIGAELGLNRNAVKQALSAWFERNGQLAPDGRRRGAKLRRTTGLPRKHEVIADTVRAYADEGLLLTEIAQRLGCNRDLVTKALQYSYEREGRVAPDGRSRRRTLAYKCTQPRLRAGCSSSIAQPTRLAG